MANHDPYDLNRFIQAQESNFERALEELRQGKKRTHWMWYIFPQIEGLGQSSMSMYYSIKSREEALAYLEHPVLGARLTECAQALLELEDRSVSDIFDPPDDLKLWSCMTLFANVTDTETVFNRVLEEFFSRKEDQITLHSLSDRIQ